MALWTKLTVRRQGYIVVAVPLICLMGSLATFWWLGRNIDLAQERVEQTNRILLNSNELLNGLLNAETGVRGYALTRRPEFLEPYFLSQEALPKTFDRLKQLVADNTVQEKRLMQMEKAAQERQAILTQLVAEINRSNAVSLRSSELNQLVLKGKIQMDWFRRSLAEFRGEEQRLLEERREILNRQLRLTDLALWVTLGISALGGILALTLFNQLEQNLRQREQKLRQSRTLLQAVVANVVDGVVTLNNQGQIEGFNAAAVQMFGHEPYEVLGQNISMLLADPITSDCEDDENQTIAQLLKVGQRWQTMGCRKGKDAFPIELSVSQLDLEPPQMIAIIRDITERQQAEAKLQSRATELAQLNLSLATTNSLLHERNRELDQFAYVASHDLKAPLRAIANLSEWIEEDLNTQLPPENQMQMQLLRARVQRMDALIDGLLEYSRAGRVKIPAETVDLKALIVEVVDLLSPPPSFQVEIASEIPTLMARRILLKQVLSNLIDNAIKHHPRSDGQIKITVEEQEDEYQFSISDDGEGIDPLYHEKIFVIFQTLQARDDYESTGVGLSIVRKIVEAEGGSVRVESQLGQGTIFSFTWPKSPNG
jgi:PAS domain S-box-containing protein